MGPKYRYLFRTRTCNKRMGRAVLASLLSRQSFVTVGKEPSFQGSNAKQNASMSNI